VVIIDTTGGITSLDRSPAVVLLTRTKLIAKKREQETRVYDLSGLEEFSLDRERVQSWATAIAQWLAAGLYPFALIGSFIYRMVQALIYALIGLLFARGVNASLSYGALVRLSVFALTPVLILCTVNDLLPVPLHAGPSSAPNRELALLPVSLPLWWLICFIVAMGYLFFAVKSNAAAQASPPQ
jgi:fatty acid desaturase